MSKVVLALATYNKGKKREYELLFKKLPIEIKALSDFEGKLEFMEEEKTFEEIAAGKALLASKTLGIPSIADDSGLSVEALNGAPGIYSARYAGKSANDKQNNNKLLKELMGKKNRDAAFICSIAIAKPSGNVITYSGKCSGVILDKPVGFNGFGYDPYFYYPPFKKSFAQLTIEEKSRVSHRGLAMENLKKDLGKIMEWLEEN